MYNIYSKAKASISVGVLSSLLAMPLELRAQGFDVRPGYNESSSPGIALPQCTVTKTSASKNLFTPSEENHKDSNSSKGSFFIDASSRQGVFNKGRFIKLLELLHDKKFEAGKPDSTNQIKCLNYFLKRSNISKCVNLEIKIPNLSNIAHHPYVSEIHKCSPGGSIFILKVVENDMQGVFVLDPLRQIKIRALDSRYSQHDFYVSATGDKHLYSGNLFISPPGEVVRDSFRSYEANTGSSAFMFAHTKGDDNTYIFKGSPFWADIFTIDLINIIKGGQPESTTPPEKQLGLAIAMCSPACLKKIKTGLESSNVFLRPDSFFFNLENELETYKNGVPLITEVQPNSEASKAGLTPGILILRIGPYGPTGMPEATSLDVVRENIYGKNRIDMLVIVGKGPDKISTEEIGWFRPRKK